MIYRRSKSKPSPYIFVRDAWNLSKRISCRPLLHASPEDLEKVYEQIKKVKDGPWEPVDDQTSENSSKEQALSSRPAEINIWKNDFYKHLESTMKGSSQKNPRSQFNRLIENRRRCNWDEIKSWIYEADIKSKSFKNRLDTLEQVRLTIEKASGEEPGWLTWQLIKKERDKFNKERKKTTRYTQNSGMSDVRAIADKNRTEDFLDKHQAEFPVETWCIAMMMNYGLRNHELFHAKSIDDNWLFIPGILTKSKFNHHSWPLYPSWVERYQIIEKFKSMQNYLISRVKPDIRSTEDILVKLKKSKNPLDHGVCVNNDRLGEWVTNHTLGKDSPLVKPPNRPLMGNVPNKRGEREEGSDLQALRPYDLRHTWAVRISVTPEWSHVSEEKAAQAMGHDLATHRKHYQRWIDEEESLKFLKSQITFPNL
jgi:integrase